MSDRHAREAAIAEPPGIKFDLDLLKPIGPNGIRMMGAGVVKHRGWSAYVALADVRSIEVRAEHEKRQDGPVVRMHRHLRTASIDSPCDDST